MVEYLFSLGDAREGCRDVGGVPISVRVSGEPNYDAMIRDLTETYAEWLNDRKLERAEVDVDHVAGEAVMWIDDADDSGRELVAVLRRKD